LQRSITSDKGRDERSLLESKKGVQGEEGAKARAADSWKSQEVKARRKGVCELHRDFA